MHSRAWIVAGSLLAFLTVALGAWGAHALRGTLSPELLEVYEVATRYAMYHSLALILLGVWDRRGWLPAAAGVCFLAGIALFSGSLYALALSGIRGLGAVTPFGGLAFLAGWACLAVAALRGGDRA
jgi:uncharacterized membrane protein YgdD (TMEM256/DUF423 family)